MREPLKDNIRFEHMLEAIDNVAQGLPSRPSFFNNPVADPCVLPPSFVFGRGRNAIALPDYLPHIITSTRVDSNLSTFSPKHLEVSEKCTIFAPE